MVECDSELVETKELSLGHRGIACPIYVQSRQIPVILRDSRRYVLWHLSELAPEENEQLGIGNMQGLFLEKFPEFDEVFSRLEDGKIAADQVDNARRYIIKRVGNQKNFDLVFSSSPHARIVAPYFEGSHVIALQKSFIPWGIDLMENINRSGFPLDWHGRSNLYRSNMTKEEIKVLLESEVLTFIQNGGKLTEGSLRRHGLKKVVFAISRYYEGGIRQLKRNLDINARTPRNLISVSTEDEFGISEIHIDRNKRMICWQLDGNTAEENLQIGIKNVQGLFLRSFPEFNEQFPRTDNGEIEQDKRKTARKFILECIGEQKTFRRIMAGATNAAYFEKSHLVALQKSFAPWGIDFFDIDIHDISSIFRDSHGRIVWYLPGRRQEASRPLDTATKIIQALFINKHSEFEQLFPRSENGEILEEKRGEALEYILRTCGSRLKFIETFGGTPLDKTSVPCFEGSFIVALIKSFGLWGLNLKQSDFKWARKNQQAKEMRNYNEDSLLQEYTDLLLSGQIMSLEEFMNRKEK